jgi:hypothetical protein
VTPERRDPDEPETPPSGLDSHGLGSNGGELSAAEIEAEFARIVAGWDLDGVPAAGEDLPRADVDADDTPTQALPRIIEPVPEPVAPVEEDDDHYVPPEPPPFPRPQPATIGAVCLLLLGIVLLAVPRLIGLSSQYGLPLGLLSITGAIVWLAARLREGPPTDSGWDDGAQI